MVGLTGMDTSTICGLIIASVLLIAFGSIALSTWSRGRFNGAVVQGKVVANDFEGGRDATMPTYAPVIRFSWQDREYTIKPRSASALAPRPLGYKLSVVIPPSGPSHARVDSALPLIPGIAFSVFGIAFLAVAISQALPASTPMIPH